MQCTDWRLPARESFLQHKTATTIASLATSTPILSTADGVCMMCLPLTKLNGARVEHTYVRLRSNRRS